jgi:hypothetical protein
MDDDDGNRFHGGESMCGAAGSDHGGGGSIEAGRGLVHSP